MSKEPIMTLTDAGRCLGWSSGRVRYYAAKDGVLVDGYTLPRYYMTHPRWFVPESWVDRQDAELVRRPGRKKIA